MRVAVLVLLVMKKPVAFAQDFHDGVIRLEYELAFKQLRSRQEYAVGTNRVVDLQPVDLTGNKVFLTMAGRRVYRSGATLQCHMVTENDRDFELIERMLELYMFKISPHDGFHDAIIGDVRALHDRLHQARCQYQHFVSSLYERVLERWMHGDRAVGRQGPRRRGPDDDICRRAAAQRVPTANKLKLHVNGRRGSLFVLHFGLCQCRTAIQTPVHRLCTLHQRTALDDAGERTQLVRLVSWVHGQIRMRPVRDHAQTDEILTLAFHLFARVLAARIPEFARGDLVTRFSMLLLDHQLDGQPMAVPTRDEGRVMARE